MAVFFLAATQFPGCGKKTETTTTDTETNNQAAISSVEDATDAITEDSAASVSAVEVNVLDTSLSTPARATETDFIFSRTCTKDSGTGVVTVVRTFSGTGTKTVTRPKITVTTDMTASGTETRVWTPPTGQSIACNGASSFAKINWLSNDVVNGLKLGVSVNKTRKFTKTFKITATGKSTSFEDSFSTVGTRNIDWISGTIASGIITRTKTVASSVTRTLSFIKQNGSTATFTSTIATKTGLSLSVIVERSSTTGELQKKTISSGTLVATISASDTKIETDFSSVVFSFSDDNVCLPISGKVTGRVYSPVTATDASHTFVIQFGADTESGVSIAVDGATASDFPNYNSKGCDLQREGVTG